MKSRTEIQAADLYVLIQRELRRRQSPECTSCFVQLPFRVDRIDEHAPNWEVLVPPECSYGCRGLLEELVHEYGMRYDLSLGGGTAAA